MRADEMSYDETDHILLVANGDPGLPFATFIDMSGVVARTDNCLPVDTTLPYGPTRGTPTLGNPSGMLNVPTCIIGQIYYDGSPQNDASVKVDDSPTGLNASIPCPDPSVPKTLSNTPIQSGVSGHGVGTGGADVPCHR